MAVTSSPFLLLSLIRYGNGDGEVLGLMEDGEMVVGLTFYSAVAMSDPVVAWLARIPARIAHRT